jgi:hypothetical protein
MVSTGSNWSIWDRAGQIGESREYWMGRVRVWWFINSELREWQRPPVSFKDRIDGAPWNMHLSCLLAHTDTRTPGSQVALWSLSCMITYLIVWLLKRDGLGPPTGCPWGFHVEDGTSAKWDLDQLFDSHSKWWPLVCLCASHVSCYFPSKVDYWFESPWHPQIWMRACSLRSNVEAHQTLWWFALRILGWH